MFLCHFHGRGIYTEIENEDGQLISSSLLVFLGGIYYIQLHCTFTPNGSYGISFYLIPIKSTSFGL